MSEQDATDEPPRPAPASWAAIALAGVIGAVTLVLGWITLVFVVGLSYELLLPIVLSYGLAAVLAAGLLVLVILLVRLAGVPRPALAALCGLGVSIALCLAGGMILWLTTGPAPPPGLFLPALPVLSATGFALAARCAHRNKALLVLVVTAAVVFALGVWGVTLKPILRP